MSALPEKLSLRETMHGHGAKGMAFYRYADKEYGVHMEARRANSRERFIETFTWDYLPGQSFPTYAALCEAAKAVTADDIAAEKAMYPYLRSSELVGDDDFANACRLCKGPGFLVIHLAHNWQPVEDSYATLCKDHQFLAQHPQALHEALLAEVAERRDRAAKSQLFAATGGAS